MKDLGLQVVLGSGEVILTLGAKFKYRCRSEFASRIRWAIWSLLRRSVMLYNSLQDNIFFSWGVSYFENKKNPIISNGSQMVLTQNITQNVFQRLRG